MSEEAIEATFRGTRHMETTRPWLLGRPGKTLQTGDEVHFHLSESEGRKNLGGLPG